MYHGSCSLIPCYRNMQEDSSTPQLQEQTLEGWQSQLNWADLPHKQKERETSVVKTDIIYLTYECYINPYSCGKISQVATVSLNIQALYRC